jgi:hypothetical protein
LVNTHNHSLPQVMVVILQHLLFNPALKLILWYAVLCCWLLGAGAAGRCEVSDCTITSNKLNGILAKDGAEVVVNSSQFTDNGQYGVQLSYCSAELKGNQVSRNKQGSVAVEIGTVTVDEEQVGAGNTLSEPVTLL